MFRKIVVSTWLSFLVILLLSLTLSAEEYILFLKNDPSEIRSLSSSAIENELTRALEKSGIHNYRKRSFFKETGFLHFSMPREEAEKSTFDTDLFLIPAGQKLYSSIIARNSSENALAVSQFPWHVEISLPLYQSAIDNDVDFNNVRVFVIDTGVQTEHPQLKAQLDMSFARHFFEVYSGDELVDIGSDNDVSDVDGHGTYVSGVVVGSTTGVCPQTFLVPIKASNEEGTMTLLALAAAVEHVIELKKGPLASKGLVVNLSFNSGPGKDETLEAFFDSILLSLSQAEVLFISSAGNASIGVGTDVDSTPVYPTFNESENFLSVSSVNETGFLDFFSNYGKRTVEIAAPGSDILTTNKDLSTSRVDGTSFASPFAAGIASIIWSIDPSLEPWQVRNLLIHAVRGKNVNENFIDEYAGSSPEFLFLQASLSGQEYGSIPLSVISGNALYPSIIANEEAPPGTSEPVVEIPGGGGCNAFSCVGWLTVLFPILICLIVGK